MGGNSMMISDVDLQPHGASSRYIPIRTSRWEYSSRGDDLHDRRRNALPPDRRDVADPRNVPHTVKAGPNGALRSIFSTRCAKTICKKSTGNSLFTSSIGAARNNRRRAFRRIIIFTGDFAGERRDAFPSPTSTTCSISVAFIPAAMQRVLSMPAHRSHNRTNRQEQHAQHDPHRRWCSR